MAKQEDKSFKEFMKVMSTSGVSNVDSEIPDISKSEEAKQEIRKYFVKKDGVSNNALISLVILSNGGAPDAASVNELTMLGYVDGNTITKEGQEFLDLPETVERLKKMVD